MRKQVNSTTDAGTQGFSLVEIVIALVLTMLVMTSVFVLLQKSQKSFAREPEVSDMNANARGGLDRISQDLAIAGFATPSNMAVMWSDGGGLTPDRIGIVYADPEVPVSRPRPCPVGRSLRNHRELDGRARRSLQLLAPASQFLGGVPGRNDALRHSRAERRSRVRHVAPGFVPFKLSGGADVHRVQEGAASGPVRLRNFEPDARSRALSDRPQPSRGFLERTSAFNARSSGSTTWWSTESIRCRPRPIQSSSEGTRRRGEPWSPVAGNIENLQVQYVQGLDENFEDVPDALARRRRSRAPG